MNRSDSIDALAKALAKAQLEMAAASKSSLNPHFKSKYAALPEVIEVAKVLNRHGLAYVQPTRSAEGTVTVETVLIHGESGQWIAGELTLTPQQNTPQGVGSAITYGRRFSLCSLVGIVADEDDDGNAASRAGPTKTTHSDPATSATIKASPGTAHNGAEKPEQIEARLAGDCAKGWPTWQAKKDWREAHRAEKDRLPMEAQLRLSRAWGAAKPMGSIKEAPLPAKQNGPTEEEIAEARAREAEEARAQ